MYYTCLVFMASHHKKCSSLLYILTSFQVLNAPGSFLFCIGNCNIAFRLLNDRYTILRRDSNPPRQSQVCYQTSALPPSHHGWVPGRLMRLLFQCFLLKKPKKEERARKLMQYLAKIVFFKFAPECWTKVLFPEKNTFL